MLPRRNDDDKGSISNTENETQLELLTLTLTIFFLTTFFLRKKVLEYKGALHWTQIRRHSWGAVNET